MYENRRVMNDVLDAKDLADLLRMGRPSETWIAPPETRALRELVRHRGKFVGLRSRVHVVGVRIRSNHGALILTRVPATYLQ